jgi:aldose 1-epimerase
MKTEPTAIELFSDLSGTLVRATISTFGGALKKLSVNKIDIVPPTEGHTPNRYGDGIVLAPWANRINHGQWTHEGKTLQLEVNEKDLDNALHGLVGTANFEITKQSESSVTLQTKVDPTAGYPFELLVSVTYELTAAGIKTTHTAQNIGVEKAPYMVGTHPYFQISGTPTEELEFKTDARSVDLVDERKIPIGKLAILGTDYDLSDWRKLKDCNFDHGFGNLNRDAKGHGHHYLRSPKGEVLDIWQSAEMTYTFIFTPDFYVNNADSTPRHAIAIEPQTAPANAFNSKEDLIWLEPNQVHSASWGAELSF